MGQAVVGGGRAVAQPLAQAVDRFYTSDVFMHTWDLARATKQDATMPDALIGHTGFVGGNLAAQHRFDAVFHSKTIESVRGVGFRLRA